MKPPAPAGDYDHALHVDHPEAPSLLQQYLDNNPVGAQTGRCPQTDRPGECRRKSGLSYPALIQNELPRSRQLVFFKIQFFCNAACLLFWICTQTFFFIPVNLDKY